MLIDKNFKVLDRNFYKRHTLVVARELLGKFIVRQIGSEKLVGKIVETEAYHGYHDKASHANCGKTERNKIMFGLAGKAYIYMIYGMYYCFNVVAGDKNYPAAVLIRAVESLFSIKKTNGPAKFCRIFKIDKKLNEHDLTRKKFLWIEDRGEKISFKNIVASKRIGIDYAQEYKDKLWRFYIKDNKFISKK